MIHNLKMNFIQNIKQTLISHQNLFLGGVRWASKKTSGSTRNPKKSTIKKHRGWKHLDGSRVTSGTLLATQLRLRFHPGLNVGMGRNGTLYAKIPGTVYVTCERPELNWDHTWVQKNYNTRKGTSFFKKYFNVIPEQQHQNFRLLQQT